MPTNLSVENNFIGGLKTEFTGLNFPENACTDTQNCVFSIIGDVLRREGIDFELDFVLQNINTVGLAVNAYKWNNAGGDGLSQIIVLQVGSNLYFFKSSAATTSSPISAQMLMPVIDMTVYLPAGSTNTVNNIECQFSDGNGYLFVFHPSLNPFYIQFAANGPVIQANPITLQIRDFYGISPEPGNPAVAFRPTMLTNEHNYNLQNQGWTNAVTWTTSSTTPNLFESAGGGGSLSLLPFPPVATNETYTVASGLTVTPGTQVNINWTASVFYNAAGDGTYFTGMSGNAQGNVISYSGTTMVINVIAASVASLGTGSGGIVSVSNQSFTITSSNLINTISTWKTQIGNYPSNADIWWEFKDAGTLTGENGVPTFNPAVTIAQVPLSVAQAPQGHFLLNPFVQQRTTISGIPSINDVVTFKRPRTGAWFQGRVWYAGVDDAFPATGDMPFSTWTENIYFSQVVVDPTNFGECFQQNDPTDDRLFDLLPTDGGVIVIQGSGPIYKLFPIQNGMLVFAANGAWIIRGNSGLGFTADDYSIMPIPGAPRTISGTSFVNVLGLPTYWNEEGIYKVSPTQQQAPYGFGGLQIDPLTVGTILSFYNEIPFDSKRFARGAYDPITYTITWVYRSTQETGVSNRYQYDSALSLNVYNKAFYPYSFASNNNSFISGILYVDYPSGPLIPSFKYLTTTPTQFTFSEERDSTNWVDWHSFDGIGVNYDSFFETGYKLHGLGFKKFQPVYVVMYSRNTDNPNGYEISGVWDYATGGNSGKFSSKEIATNAVSNFGMVYRRHKIRGHGNAFQIRVDSIDGMPFDIMGWSVPEQINVGP
jgi:hypothetical protein